jgi:hypothetical protein
MGGYTRTSATTLMGWESGLNIPKELPVGNKPDFSKLNQKEEAGQ